jgi:integrase
MACQQQRLSSNPFDTVKASHSINQQRQAYVSVSTLQPLLEQAPTPWRLLLALCRFAGLRCPTEVLSLRWDQIDFIQHRMTVHAPKTEHIPGKANRIVPIFARLRPYLDEARTHAQADAVYVVS